MTRQGIAIYGSERVVLQENKQVLVFMLERLLQCGFKLYINSKFVSVLQPLPSSLIFESVIAFPSGRVDMVISFGGDGTMLHAAQWVGQCGTPILGINAGHLGYLTAYTMSREDAELAVRLLCSDTGIVNHRMVLKLDMDCVPDGFWPYAVNEVALLRNASAQMLTVRTDVDGRYLADYRGDGLIVATPSGSTAYNMSAGGPILEPSLQNIVLTPIAPHSLNMRPLVIGGDAVVEAKVSSRTRSFRVSLDGRTFDVPCSDEDDISNEGKLRISRAEFTVNTIHDPRTDFASVLRSKLLWGAR